MSHTSQIQGSDLSRRASKIGRQSGNGSALGIEARRAETTGSAACCESPSRKGAPLTICHNPPLLKLDTGSSEELRRVLNLIIAWSNLSKSQAISASAAASH